MLTGIFLIQTASPQMSVRIRAVWSEHYLFDDLYYSIHWLCKRVTKVQISLRECTGWTEPALSANCIKAFFVRCTLKKVREKSRECHNHKPQPFPDPKRKRKPTNPNKHKPNKRTKSTTISSLFPKREKMQKSWSLIQCVHNINICEEIRQY